MRAALISLAGTLVVVFARFITAARGVWEGVGPTDEQRIYFANHASHGDFVLIWTVLPRRVRNSTRPVAGSDYWLTSRFRRFIGCEVFKAVLIDRERVSRTADPIRTMTNALDASMSLIVFPEGTRNTTAAPLLPFKSGLFHLARARSRIPLVPVWIDNLNRVLPKGEFVPIPLICTVTFGTPIFIADGESKQSFLARAEQALLSLAPKANAS